MKNVYLYLLLAVSSFLFVSCDDDVARAITLSGQWRGDFGMWYEEEYRGKILHYDCDETEMIFYPDYDYATHGWGKQVDWYDRGPYDHLYYRFKWDIRDGVIYLTYKYDHNLDTEIYEYKMNNDRFSGYCGNSNYRFHLYKIADYYDWSNYDDSWDYYYWGRDWDYTRAATGSSVSDSSSTTVPFQESEHRIIRRGNRFNN